MGEYLLEMRDVSKSFVGVQALSRVSLKVKEGEVHCLMGENGAGKSTLIKILAGTYKKDEGQIFFEDKKVDIKSIKEAQMMGMSFIHQELSVVNALTVEENMTLGYEESNYGFVDRKTNIRNTQEIFKNLDIEMNCNEVVGNLSVSKKQMMLIAKALSHNSKLIVMDEPTASLTDTESEALFEMIKKLKKQGVSFIYISHRFNDIFTIGDTITVFRDGLNVGELDVKSTNENELIKLMVGRELKAIFPEKTQEIGEEILKIEGLAAVDLIKDVSFSVHRGEVIGVSGLAGAGKTELARAIFGDNRITKGKIYYKDKVVSPKNPKDAIDIGIAYLPEERRHQGIVGLLSVRENLSLASPKLISKNSFIKRKKDKNLANKYISNFKIKTPSTEQQIQYLSGGNQQKVIIAKWISTNADVILLDEPTRGIDVSAKKEIYDLINELAKQGKAIIMFSSEMPELIGMCDSIVTLHEGVLTGVLDKDEVTQEKLMELAMEVTR